MDRHLRIGLTGTVSTKLAGEDVLVATKMWNTSRQPGPDGIVEPTGTEVHE
jgi:hypothetical protein